MKLEFHPAYAQDLVATASYYEAERAGCGSKFLEAAEAAVDQLLAFPESGPRFNFGVRRLVLRKFPHVIRYCYHPERNLLRLLSIIHTARHPATATDRL